MLLLIGRAAYWMLTGLFTLGLFNQWRNLKAYSLWQPPSTVRDHQGENLSSNSLFFAEPGRAFNRLTSADATHRTISIWTRFRAGFAGALTGAAWGWFGVWISSVSDMMLQIAIISSCGAIMAWAYLIDVQPAHITYACADGFGIISARVSRWRTLLPRSVADRSHAFADFVLGIPHERQLVLYESDGTIVSRTTLQCPVEIRTGDWQRWIGAVACAFDEVRWSRALCHLAMWSKQMGDLPISAHILTAFMFDMVSVLGTKSPYGPDFSQCQDGTVVRTPTGRLGFAEDGLVVENWIPLYDAIVNPETLAQVVLYAREISGGVGAPDDVRQILEVWRRDHVQIFPLASIESLDEGEKHFTIRIRNGQVFEFDRSHVIGYPTFWRLVQSAIWPNGIEEQLRRELVKDLDEVRDATAMTQIPGVIFGELLPKHRKQVWYEAYKLGIVAEEDADCHSLSTHLFRESCRLLGRSYRGPLADCSFGNSSESATEIGNDLTEVDSSSDASGPIIPTANRPESQGSPNTDV